MRYHDTWYARPADGAYIAYQTEGVGPPDIAHCGMEWGNIDVYWDGPGMGAWLHGLASIGRVIVHDRRGTGISSRNVPIPNLETRVSDLGAVLDAAAAEQVIVFGHTEGGAVGAMFAATYPERVSAFVWVIPMARSVWAPEYPWGAGPDYIERERAQLEAWRTNEYGKTFQEMESVWGHEVSDDRLERISFLSRQTTTPDVAREFIEMWHGTDVRGVLPAIQVPTLLIGDAVTPAEAEYVGSRIPDASVFVHPLPGASEDPERIPELLDRIRTFVGIEARPVALDTILSTVLFTDIVGSTEKQAALGDHGWRSVLERHHVIVRETLQRWRGVENDTAGDGFYATFDGPARAIHAALEICDNVRQLGIEVRAGVHTGECEVIDGKCAGLTVSIGSRVASAAGASQVLVSQTVKDLVAGSGFRFDEAGERELKGVPGSWRLYEVALASTPAAEPVRDLPAS